MTSAYRNKGVVVEKGDTASQSCPRVTESRDVNAGASSFLLAQSRAPARRTAPLTLRAGLPASVNPI